MRRIQPPRAVLTGKGTTDHLLAFASRFMGVLSDAVETLSHRAVFMSDFSVSVVLGGQGGEVDYTVGRLERNGRAMALFRRDEGASPEWTWTLTDKAPLARLASDVVDRTLGLDGMVAAGGDDDAAALFDLGPVVRFENGAVVQAQFERLATVFHGERTMGLFEREDGLFFASARMHPGHGHTRAGDVESAAAHVMAELEHAARFDMDDMNGEPLEMVAPGSFLTLDYQQGVLCLTLRKNNGETVLSRGDEAAEAFVEHSRAVFDDIVRDKSPAPEGPKP